MTLGFLFGSKSFCKLLLCFLRSFCFARIWLDPLGGQVHHDCISMIVSRFTTFTENIVICCNQITKIFCTRYDSANTSCARSPLWFWSSGRSRNFGLSGSEFQHRVYPKSALLVGSKDGSWEELACESGTLSSTRFSLNSCNHSGMSE